MQLLAIVLYSTAGTRRVLTFKPGALNIVTGESATGKSALLAIFEYCLGRDTVQLPVGPISTAVSWYAALFQLDGSRVFVARPALSSGRKSSTRAMIRVSPDQGPLEYEDLKADIDTRTLREHLGRRIGIRENFHETPGLALEAHLGHATLLCLQSQGEIASPGLLFHRQGEPGVAEAIKSTLPYFLGAAPHDQARKHAQLTAARRSAQEAETKYLQARQASATSEPVLSALWREAHTLGMVSSERPPDRTAMIAALREAITAVFAPDFVDRTSAEQDAFLRRECGELRDQLRGVAADRKMLLEQTSAGADFATSALIPRDRLASLNLLGLNHDDLTATAPQHDVTRCALCGSTLPAADPTVAALSRSLNRLTQQLADIESVRPASRRALEALDDQASQLRSQLLEAEGALQALIADETATEQLPQQARLDFLRGRIHGVLSTLSATPVDAAAEARQLHKAAVARVRSLENDLDLEEERAQVAARLVPIGQEMTTWSGELGLEHHSRGVHLDLDLLTVTLGTGKDAVPLSRIGSAGNWIAYHVVAHLALHRYFVRQNRPVPRILILDQPSQAWYPAAGEGDQQESGLDRQASEELFALIHSAVRELAPDFQVIVCDHVSFPAPWFQESIVQNWRDGEKLVPQEWIDERE